MGCPMCKYEFCWYCLNEFYSEFHINKLGDTPCPFRVYLIRATYSFISILFYFRIMKAVPVVEQLTLGVIDFILSFVYFLFVNYVTTTLYWILKTALWYLVFAAFNILMLVKDFTAGYTLVRNLFRVIKMPKEIKKKEANLKEQQNYTQRRSQLEAKRAIASARKSVE